MFIAADLFADERAPQASNMRIDQSNKHAQRHTGRADTQGAFEEAEIKVCAGMSELDVVTAPPEGFHCFIYNFIYNTYQYA